MRGLLDGDPVEVDQSALTGESLPVTCKCGGAVFSGSIVRQGEIDALVYGTGMNTYFGKTAQLVQEAHTVSHFQKAVLKIGNYLIILAGCFSCGNHYCCNLSRRSDPHHTAIRFGADRGLYPGSDADSIVGNDGSRRAPARKKEAIVSRLVAIEELAGVDISLRGQDRHFDSK